MGLLERRHKEGFAQEPQVVRDGFQGPFLGEVPRDLLQGENLRRMRRRDGKDLAQQGGLAHLLNASKSRPIAGSTIASRTCASHRTGSFHSGTAPGYPPRATHCMAASSGEIPARSARSRGPQCERTSRSNRPAMDSRESDPSRSDEEPLATTWSGSPVRFSSSYRALSQGDQPGRCCTSSRSSIAGPGPWRARAVARCQMASRQWGKTAAGASAWHKPPGLADGLRF